MHSLTLYLLSDELLSTSVVYSQMVANARNRKDSCIRTTYEDIQDFLELDRCTIQRAVSKLIELGMVERINKVKYKVKLPNEPEETSSSESV
jgi:predicted transcriptional regulator of viral defense system